MSVSMYARKACKRFRVRWLLPFFFIVLVTSACSVKPIDYEQVSEEEKIIVRFSHVVGEDTPKGQAARRFASLIKERTQGKVEVQVFANSSLYTDYEELKALQDGYIQIIAPAFSKLSTLVPEVEVFDLPFLYKRLDDYHRVLDGEAGKRLAEMMQRQGLKPLAYWDNSFKQFTSSNRPIHLPTDLQGLKMRIMPSTVLNRQMRLLGAQPIEISFNDVYLSLEKGELDGQENTVSNIYTKHFHRVQQYLTISDHGYLGYFVLMNQEFWQQLPADIQTVMVETMREVTLWERQKAEEINTEQLQQIKACNCIDIKRLSQSERDRWKQYVQPLYQSELQKWDQSFVSALHIGAR